MPALDTGTAAPPFSLPDITGRKVSLKDELKKGPVVLAFFKVTCPVCQLAFPYLERIYEGMHGKANIIGISQHPLRETKVFASEYDVAFPILLDDTHTYPVSNAYGITNVPTIFVIAPNEQIELTSVGWSRRDIEELNRRLARALGTAPADVFHRGEDVPAFKAG